MEARAHAHALASRVEQDDFELQTALAISASRADNHATAHLQAELALQQHRTAQLRGLTQRDLRVLGVESSRLGATAALSRTRGQALAARYWISHSLDCDEVLDAAADGFYDVWGSFEGVVGGPARRALRTRLTDPSMTLKGARVRGFNCL